MTPSIAQLVERWTVVVMISDIHRSLVQIRLEGSFASVRKREKAKKKLAPRGIEPVTFALLARRSNQLS